MNDCDCDYDFACRGGANDGSFFPLRRSFFPLGMNDEKTAIVVTTMTLCLCRMSSSFFPPFRSKGPPVFRSFSLFGLSSTCYGNDRTLKQEY
jgi:hypothetical protein